LKKYFFLVGGTAFLLVGVSTIIALILTLVINKDSRLYKYLTKPENKGVDKYLQVKFNEETYKKIIIVIRIVVGIVFTILGLNTLLKGIIDPYGFGVWFLF